MMRNLLSVLLFSLLFCGLAVAQNVDTDSDGLPDAAEKALGTDPAFAEPMVQIGKDKTRDEGDAVGKDNYAPGLDLVAVHFGNVAGDRTLWRIDFAGPYVADNSGLIIYLDADSNRGTGRQDMGCEYMLLFQSGNASVRAFSATGAETPHWCRAAVVDRSLYLCTDLKLLQADGNSTGVFHILHETRQPYASVDSMDKTPFKGPGESTRAKLISPMDETRSRNMEVTWGFGLLRDLKARAGNLLLPAWEGQLRGYQLNIFTEYANRHVIQTRETPHTVTVKAPRSGKFHVGFFTYQPGGRQNMLVKLNDQELGLAVATEGNRRQCLFFTSKPVSVKQGDAIELESLFGNQLVEEVVLLPEKPPVTRLERKLTHLQARPALTLDGRLTGEVTFVTSWPAVCKVTYNGLSQEDPEPLASHRFWLPELQPGQKCEVVVEAETPEGQKIKQQTALTLAVQPPAGKVTRADLPLTCNNAYSFPLQGWPVTQGLPFPQGALVSADHLRLLDASRSEVPLQATVLGYWPDYSIKWVLLDFQTNLPAAKTADFTLQYGTQVRRSSVTKPLQIATDPGALVVNSGPLKVEIPAGQQARGSFLGRLWLDRNGDGVFADDELLSGADQGRSDLTHGGQTTSTRDEPASAFVLRSGPLHSIVRVNGPLTPASPAPRDQLDLHFYAGKPYVAVHHTFTNTFVNQTFTNFDSLYLSRSLSLGGNARGSFGVEAGATPATALTADGATLWQGFDDSYRITGLGAATGGKRAANWGDVTADKAGVTVAIRYLWQLYPKSLTLRPDGVDVGLMPKFDPGTYRISKEGQLEDKLYYYLKDDVYKLKAGVSKRHEMLWVFHGPQDAPAASEAAAFDEPPVLKAAKEWYCDSKSFADILPSSPELGGIFATYESNVQKAAAQFIAERERGKEYGMLNFGDWWGERGRNWGNIEYDTQYAFYLQFVRSGDERFLRLAEQAARHNRDVDMIWAGDPHQVGKVYSHCIGHTGNYYDHAINNQGSPSGGCSVSHSWCEGYLADYFLSGDVRGLEAATTLANVYDGYYLNNYEFDNNRTNGWHLILTMGQYRATGDPFYLNAARIIVERTKEREDPGGGWIREMTPGHCLCLPRHRGEAAFMMGILMSGLRDYNFVARDPEVDRMIARAAHYLIRACWVPEKKAMRYTSCPVSSSGGGLSELITEGMMHGYMLSPDKVLGEVVKAGTVQEVRNVSGSGKGLTMQIRRTPAILYQFAQADLDNYNFAPGQTVQMLLRAPTDAGFRVTLRPRGEGQLGGKAVVLKDDKVVAEAALDRRPAVLMDVKAGTGAGTYLLKLQPAGQVPWDVDCDLDQQAVDCRTGVRFGPGVRLPSYVVQLPLTGKTTLSLSGVTAAQLKSPEGKVLKPTLKGGAAQVVLDAAQGFKGLCTLDLTTSGVFSVKLDGTLPYLSYWPSQLFAPGQPIAAFTVQGTLGPGGNPNLTLDASATSDVDNDIVAYNWDFGDGTRAEGKVVSHRFKPASTFAVVLTVRDKLGTASTVKQALTVPPQWVFDLASEGAVVIEAEKFTGQGLGEVLITQRTGQIGSLITRWEATVGHWLDWQFDLPKDGQYHVILRFGSGSDSGCRRVLTVDGQSPGPGFTEIRLPHTGGFGDRASDWQYHRVPAQPGGAPTEAAAVLSLKAGPHTLRLANLAGGCALDQIILVPAR